jgi:CDP-glycerol glycerophosphotransferase
VDISQYAAVEVDFDDDLQRANSMFGGDAPNIVAGLA